VPAARSPAAGALAVVSLLASACSRTAEAPPEVQVTVGAQQVSLRPTQYCLDGSLRRYDVQPPVIAAPPATRITLTVPGAVAGRGWSVQVFDAQLAQQLGEVPVGKGQAVLDQITTSDPTPPGFYLVAVEARNEACHSLGGAWPVGFLRSGEGTAPPSGG
jgi:hypothetical protein